MLKIGTLDSPEVKPIGPANSNALYSSGYLLYVRQNTLMAQSFEQAGAPAQAEYDWRQPVKQRGTQPAAYPVTGGLLEGRYGIVTRDLFFPSTR
jgi:hypothetical protein